MNGTAGSVCRKTSATESSSAMIDSGGIVVKTKIVLR